MGRRKESVKVKALRGQVKKLAKKSKFWRAVMEELERANRRGVNVYKLNRFTKPNESVIILGKLLGTGELNHPLTVVALSFSKTAYDKVLKAGGKAILIEDFLRQNPKPSGVRIVA